MPDKRILIIHPYVRTTFFLNRIKNHLQNHFPDDVHYFSVKPNDTSHNECLERIKRHTENGLIVFLGHGRTDRLFGSRTDKSKATVSEDARNEFQELYYNNEDFINEGNVDVFKKKKVFCLACNSNAKISDFAIHKEAVTFLGFGDIPTSLGEFIEKKKYVSNNMIRLIKTEISFIIKKSLVYGIKNKLTFERLWDIICFISNQRIVFILKNYTWFKESHLLADYLYFLKKEITIKGSKNISLVD